MALRLVQVNFKARDDAALGGFWAEALGWGTSSEGPGVTNVEPIGFVWPDPSAVCVDVVTVPDPESVHYRVHLDLASRSAEHYAKLIERLQALGATSVTDAAVDLPWTTLADPEGNHFRVLERRALYEDTGPIAAVVVDCADPRALSAFWDQVIDWTLIEANADVARMRSSHGVGPSLVFVRSTGMPAPSRVHLDVRPYAGDDKTAEVRRLEALGAVAVDIGQGAAPWSVLTDPEGNEFCVLTSDG